jgi:hypothetical protein
MTAPVLRPDVDLLDLLADLDLIRCGCGCGSAFDLADYEARARETGVRVFPLSTSAELAERYGEVSA